MPLELTGDAIIRTAQAHLNEPYILGARAPMANARWQGPWDCAEFVSWCVFQTTGILFGTRPSTDAILADAFTGFWFADAHAANATIPVESAVGIVGAILLRAPAPQAIGHIAFSDGAGGTVEAFNKKRGVIRSAAGGRRWDVGVLVPGVTYFQSDEPVSIEPPPAQVLRVTHPLMRGALIKKVQRALLAAGFNPGNADGVYGPQTAHAVRDFQSTRDLVADGEVGPATLKALKLKIRE
jgi:N-acetylmuramoyl-L-alanine amidase